MDLFADITDNTIVLTPNLRLAVVLQKQHQEKQLSQKKSCWFTLPILEISRWFQKLWFEHISKEMGNFPFLLSANQEQILWEEILQNSKDADHLLQISSTAELAKAAWGVLKQWQVELNHPSLQTTEDGMAFCKWATEFQQLCKKNHWLDVNSITDILIKKIQDKSIIPPSHIILVGFAELSPQQKDFMKHCEQVGNKITYYEPHKTSSIVQRVSVKDTETEIRTLARWAKSIYEKTVNDTICCVIPNLEDCRERVIQIFSHVFTEENTYSLDHTKLPFNISAGRSLAAYPIIFTALEILKLATKPIPIDSLSYLLRSPYLGESESDMLDRAKLDSILRRENISVISWEELADKHTYQLSKLFLKRIRTYLNAFPNKKTKLPISQWVSFFLQSLTILGWPGERSLDSAEYQTTKAWLNLLSEYASYENILGPVSYSQALHYLAYLTGKAVFQPESPEARIQILGPLEAAALPFDHLWVMGLNDTAWPQSPKPNPFIPQGLQKQLLMPRASAERELTYAKQITEQFKTNAKRVIFSYNMQDGDTELRPSPLIIDVPEATIQALELSNFMPVEQTLFASQQLEYLQDNTAPTISGFEKIRGGSTIFKYQAMCPFKAFAELRLHAKKIDPPTLGLRPKDRGDIVHNAMERIWHALKDQATLKNLPSASLLSLVQDAITQAIKHVMPTTASNKRFLSLESQRLEKLLLDWLELEKSRPPFKIQSLEEECKATVGKIPVTVRADRIDTLENGKTIIIDYKTGKTNPAKDWFDERPNEPQLPLYSLLNTENAIGILFAQINTEEMKWKGISEIPLDIDSVKTLYDERNTDATSWKEQLEKWKQVLEQLGDDFYNGIAHINPKDEIETCRHCHLHTLCRVQEMK